MGRPYGTRKLKAVGKDIVHLEDKEAAKKNISELIEQFYAIMRKHGIKWGTKDEDCGGTTGANFEWTLCKDAFIYRVTSLIEWEMLVNPPEDLMHYDDEKP
ncbi:MAG: hypothetical protein AMJ42_04565 [Deltaproteobacteria bacterium DG_8]|nr:MAG: hypothetical protein AMJ42_04565 [Deltaproteobacteria bacterium DG_8]